jgi:hypothetical protein
MNTNGHREKNTSGGRRSFGWVVNKTPSSKTSTTQLWAAHLKINSKRKKLGYFKTEIEAAKYVNFVCRKESQR